MDDLVRWLGEQLDADAAHAQRAIDGPRNAFVSADEDVEPLLFDDEGVFVLPARVLREIDAKRDLLRFAEGVHDHHDTFTTGVAARLEKTLRLFALAYADREGYRPEWRP